MLLLTVARPRGVLTRFPILPAGERETRMLFAEKIVATFAAELRRGTYHARPGNARFLVWQISRLAASATLATGV